MEKLRTPAVLLRAALATAAGFAALQVVLGLLYGRTAEEIVRRAGSIGGAVLVLGLVATACVLLWHRWDGSAREDRRGSVEADRPGDPGRR